MERGFKPRALGEIAIRCDDIVQMAQFYQDIIGLERLSSRADGNIIFFKISEGFNGHTTVLALFDRALGPNPSTKSLVTGANSALHHLALSLPYEEQEATMRWYAHNNQPYTVEIFDWIGWRGVFTQDPEGNTVELVAYQAALKAPS